MVGQDFTRSHMPQQGGEGGGHTGNVPTSILIPSVWPTVSCSIRDLACNRIEQLHVPTFPKLLLRSRGNLTIALILATSVQKIITM